MGSEGAVTVKFVAVPIAGGLPPVNGAGMIDQGPGWDAVAM
jgi:hypothetical protein